MDNAKNQSTNDRIVISSDPQAQKVVDGFTLNWMKLADADTGMVIWESDWKPNTVFKSEQIAKIPASVLKTKTVSREINFSSKEAINKFRLKQQVFFQGFCMEEWNFEFGFVIPGSTNSWQSTILAAEESQMIPAEILSGNVYIETNFYDGDTFICRSVVRVYYDEE